MRKNKLIKAIIIFIAALFVSATPIIAVEDLRALQLRSYLEKIGSPMVGHELKLIETAEKYGLDWTLLAAIAGTESTFGKRMPYQCINPYGWGIYGDNKICFADFDDAIERVGEGIGTKYNTGSLETIARKYNTVTTDSWISHTRFFMNKIKSQAVSAKHLPIEL